MADTWPRPITPPWAPQMENDVDAELFQQLLILRDQLDELERQLTAHFSEVERLIRAVR